jgi:hypothetical protein
MSAVGRSARSGFSKRIAGESWQVLCTASGVLLLSSGDKRRGSGRATFTGAEREEDVMGFRCGREGDTQTGGLLCVLRGEMEWIGIRMAE